MKIEEAATKRLSCPTPKCPQLYDEATVRNHSLSSFPVVLFCCSLSWFFDKSLHPSVCCSLSWSSFVVTCCVLLPDRPVHLLAHITLTMHKKVQSMVGAETEAGKKLSKQSLEYFLMVRVFG